jgi:maleylacetoacetate isomerase
MKLYTYWRSQATFRVRIALNLKGLHAQPVELDILKGDQFRDEYRQLNPQMAVPTLIDDDGSPPLTQSLAILEYLEERYPTPPLLPAGFRDRAYARALALALAADAHPFVTPRVRGYLERELHADRPAVIKWMLHWMMAGLATVEANLARDPRTAEFCIGNAPTLADLCLVPHIVSAKIFPDFDFSPYPTAMRIFERCMSLDAFRSVAPAR